MLTSEGVMKARAKSRKLADGDLVWLPVDSLRPWGGNPRVNEHAVPKVAESIRRFGFGAPLVVRLDGMELITGHTRIKAARIAGLDKVPVHIRDISEQEAHALAIADNKLGELAEWDPVALGLTVDDEGHNLVDLGFGGSEAGDLLSASVLDDASAEDGWGTMREAQGSTATARAVTVSLVYSVEDANEAESLIRQRAEFGELRGATLMRALRALAVP